MGLIKKTILLLVFSTTLAFVTNAEEEAKIKASIFEFSIFPPVQLINRDADIYGLRLAMPYADNQNVAGLDLGFWNYVHNNTYGVQAAVLVAQRRGNANAWSFAGLANLSHNNNNGPALAGVFNGSKGHMKGPQLSLLVNYAKKLSGAQFGLVNYCDDMNGMQFGLVNICKSQPLYFTIIFNFNFNMKAK